MPIRLARIYFRRLTIWSSLLLLTTGYFLFSDVLPDVANHALRKPLRSQWHPIDRLIDEVNMTFHRLLQSRSTNLSDAAARYRERRGRHPPPGFGAWW
ncbi:hypothetical protein CMQ_4679 [Grosmannia clavigera kw1407]|uniref:Uncharacterized protein n=1 Tax=Grosmannia clavigera (strain kw1407 / UAMH 11150) TaxID=655863 RepID=F0XV55_GROCL|nr:uncharacterized protein CMQ_4679 [Grosmannia clavigera kw1407]EFW98827.1 hypothetical protein CMQ_4679 [Grosmannia clavigera kw1407]